MKRIAIALVLVLSGCTGSAERTDVPSNKAFDVDVLFTDSDGYTVKRFRDAGYLRYYVTPGPGTVVGRTGEKHALEIDIPTAAH